MDTAAILATLASGSVIGLILGLVGGGGSILAVPLLIYFVGVGSPQLSQIRSSRPSKGDTPPMPSEPCREAWQFAQTTAVGGLRYLQFLHSMYIYAEIFIN